MNLDDLGWGEPFKSIFLKEAAQDEFPGRVVEEQRGAYKVQTEAGELLARITGSLRHAATQRKDFPAVGDWVILKILPEEASATLLSILPRTSLLARKASGNESDDQLIAANLDTVFIVTSLNKDFHIRKLERYLTMVSSSGATPVILLSKADLMPDPASLLRDIEASAPDIAVFAVSAKTGMGLAQLDPYLKQGKTIALIGSSGVGKSTLINRLSGSDSQAVQEVRARDDSGRHTTTSRRLVPLPQGGLLIDTPGMRELRLTETAGMTDAFADILALTDACRFQNCKHQSDAGCAVQGAITQGTLDPGRFAHFLRLGKESADLTAQRETEARAKANEKFKQAQAEYKRERRNK